MRIVFTGITPMVVKTAEQLIEQGHEIVLIDLDKEKIDKLSEDLDCSFLHGDAGIPAILKETSPKDCNFLFCLTDNDQSNIITSLLGRSMGFKKIITCIQDEDLLSLCDELGLEYVIIPDRTMSQYLDNIIRGLDTIELSTLLRGSARFFSFIAGKNDTGKISELELPDKSKVIYYYRDDEFHFSEEDTSLRKGDEVIILTDSKHLADLNERWKPQDHNDQN